MRSLKSHFSFTLALFAILFSLQTFLSVIKVIETYETRLQNNYSMIILSHAIIEEATIKNSIDKVASFIQLPNETILAELDHELDPKQINLLKATLPNFYELRIDHFPQPQEISKITNKLLKVEGIFQVESFAKRHDQVYNLLLIIKTIIKLFGLLTIVIGVLLILKEMRLWQYAHQNRMHIMALFGSPIWLRSAVLFRFAIIDAFFATIITSILFMLLERNTHIIAFLETLQVNVTLFSPLKDPFVLLGVALVTAITLALLLVLRRPKAMH